MLQHLGLAVAAVMMFPLGYAAAAAVAAAAQRVDRRWRRRVRHVQIFAETAAAAASVSAAVWVLQNVTGWALLRHMGLAVASVAAVAAVLAAAAATAHAWEWLARSVTRHPSPL